MSYLDEVKKGVNPHGIAYADMTKGKHVVVDIPIKHGKDVVEVEGTISSALWYDHPCHSVNSQINLNKIQSKMLFRLVAVCMRYMRNVSSGYINDNKNGISLPK